MMKAVYRTVSPGSRVHVTVTWLRPLSMPCITTSLQAFYKPSPGIVGLARLCHTQPRVNLYHVLTNRPSPHNHPCSFSKLKYLRFTSIRISRSPCRYLHSSSPLSGGSRLIPEGRKERKAKVKVKEKTVLLIDDDGTNLGEMDGRTATKLADSKGLKIVLVNRETPERCAVYKLMSGKKLYEEEKIRKQKAKKDPRQVTKEIAISTKIDSHDLEVKLSHMKDILSRLHNVRVVIEVARIPRFADNREERVKAEKEKQAEMVHEIETALIGVGVKLAKENSVGRNRLQCTFRSVASDDQK